MAGQEAGRRPRPFSTSWSVAGGDPGGVKRRAAAMQAWPAKGKLVN
jgi:hypothetical protein